MSIESLVSLGVRPQICSENHLERSTISVAKYGSNHICYIADIYKDENSQLLIASGAVSFLKSNSRLGLAHYGLRENGVSGFIKSQVTGEAFVMTEVIGSGNIRLRPYSNLLATNHYQNTKFYLPHTNIPYLVAILGAFEISNMQKIKSSIPLSFTEINLQNALVLLETEEIYEIFITPDTPIEVEASDIAFWTGDINLEEVKESAEGNLVKFQGSGQIYLSLATT